MRLPCHNLAQRPPAARIVRPIVAFMTFLVALLLVAHARADGAAKAIAIYVEGPEADAVRAAVQGIVPDRLRVVDPAALANALAKEGQRGAFGATLTIAKQRGKALTRIRKAAATAGADAVVAIRTKKSGFTSIAATVLLVDQIPGDLAVDEDIILPSAAEGRKAALRKVLGTELDDLAGVKAEAKAEGKAPTATADHEDGTPAEPTKSTGATSARQVNKMSTALFAASLGLELGTRFVTYKDAITANIRSYDIEFQPMPAAGLELYPAAGSNIPVLKDLGLTGDFARAVGLSSETKSGIKLGTTWMRFGGGLRARIHPGSADGPVFGLNGGVSFTSFLFDGPIAFVNAAPSVSYLTLRGGLDARIPFWRMALLLDAGYDGALSAGAIHDRFTGAKVGGIDFGGGLAVVLGAGFEARLTANYTRYFYAFDPVPGDAYVAGGAVDEFIMSRIGVAYAY